MSASIVAVPRQLVADPRPMRPYQEQVEGEKEQPTAPAAVEDFAA